MGEGARALVGVDGWLFLLCDSNRVADQHAGRLKIAPSELKSWELETHRRVEVCASVGARYLLLIAPDKRAVYPEHLPPGPSARRRPVHRLLNRLNKFSAVCYPLSSLRAERKSNLVYGPCDTHWTDFGALVACNDALVVLGQEPIDTTGLVYVEENAQGDLGALCTPPRAGAWVRVTVPISPIWSNGIRHTGRIALFRGSGKGGRCLVFGNSFFEPGLATGFARAFSEILFVFADNVDYELIRREKPNAVIHQTCERFLIRSPRDHSRLSGRERGTIKWLLSLFGRSRETLSLAELHLAALAGSLDCSAQLAAVEHVQRSATATPGLRRARAQEDVFAFGWSLALGLSGECESSYREILRANSRYPERSLIRKYVRFFLELERQDLVRGLARHLRDASNN